MLQLISFRGLQNHSYSSCMLRGRAIHMDDPFWLWVYPSVFPSWHYLLKLSSLTNSWFWRVNSAIVAAMDCTCWTEGGCTVGTDWRSPLLSWGLGLRALDLVQTISALCRRKKSQNPTMEFKRYSSPQTAPTDESCDISGLKVSGLDEFVTKSWENKQKTQRRPVQAFI